MIDYAEALTVIDVNSGSFIGRGKGAGLEDTITKTNLEAAEEVVNQLRLRDIGGIIVIDFIDMVLESNRELVLRRLTECLGRDRTRHQVAEVTSLGLVLLTLLARSSVLRLARVYLIDPVQDPALQIQYALEPDRAKEICSLRAAATHLAVQHDLVIRVQLAKCFQLPFGVIGEPRGRDEKQGDGQRRRCGMSTPVSTNAFGTSAIERRDAYGRGARRGSHAIRILAAFECT